MKILLFIVFGVLSFTSCQKNETKTIDCIESITLATHHEDLVTVKSQKVDGELHYWLNTNANYYDGAEYIVNSSCDTICSFCGECILPLCIDDYDVNDWVVIWEK